MCWRRGTFANPPTSAATECIDFRGGPVELHHIIGPVRTACGLVALATRRGRGFALPLS